MSVFDKAKEAALKKLKEGQKKKASQAPYAKQKPDFTKPKKEEAKFVAGPGTTQESPAQKRAREENERKQKIAKSFDPLGVGYGEHFANSVTSLEDQLYPRRK
jgi:hypothetical protein